MSTRGLWGFAVGGEVKVTYNHSDSYPSGLGDEVLKFAHGITPEVRERAGGLHMVNQDGKPTPEEIKRLAWYANRRVGSQQIEDWYVLLRETQGDPVATLDAGVMIESRAFAADSLFCEWGYVIDLDENRFEVYRGFQHAPHTEGRFAADERHDGEYWPIRLVASYPLDALTEELDEGALSGEEDDE